MNLGLTDLREARDPPRDDLAGLFAYLAQLAGEPFRLARVSCGDELTLHFGDLRPARSPKLKHHLYGEYILGLRGSPWVLKSGPLVLTAGVFPDSPGSRNPLRNEELEAGRFIEPESRVSAASPFVVRPANVFGLLIRMADGSTLSVIPTARRPDGPGDEVLPDPADWDLLSPHGLLRAGPGLGWSFAPRLGPPEGRPRA